MGTGTHANDGVNMGPNKAVLSVPKVAPGRRIKGSRIVLVPAKVSGREGSIESVSDVASRRRVCRRKTYPQTDRMKGGVVVSQGKVMKL